MKFKVVIACFALAITATLTGCTGGKKPVEVIGCTAQDTLVQIATLTISTELTCTNMGAIKDSVLAEVEKIGMCKQAEQAEQAEGQMAAKSVIGNVLCGPAVDAVMLTAQAQIPAAWQCDPSAKVETLKAKLLEACQKAL